MQVRLWIGLKQKLNLVMEIIKVLTSMGYRLMSPNVWGKPFGYNLLTYETDKNLWTNWFTSIDKNPLIWNNHTFKTDSDSELTLEEQFKQFIIISEAYTSIRTNTYSDFSFLSDQETINFML